MLDRSCLLRDIQELEFAALDLNLYLDNHPDCERAIFDYNLLYRELQKKKRMFEMNFGPLSNFGTAPSKCPFEWVDEPWPWEN